MSVLEDFFAAPSESLLVALTKEQLVNVADFYGIELALPKTAKKDKLIDFIRDRLKENQVLPDNPAVSSPPAKSNELTYEQQNILLQMQLDQKRWEFEQKKLEIEQDLERKRMESIEREKDCLFEREKLKHLEYEQERARELERTRLKLVAEGRAGGNSSQNSGVANMIKFLPKFNERDPDIFFSLFENVAADQNWSDEDKTLLLQTVLVGRAQEAFVALSFVERKSYQSVKEAVLKSYELIPEAYRQCFRNWRKSEKQTHADVARELSSFFNRWRTAEEIDSFNDLCDLVILEQFKNILPKQIATYLNEQKVKTAAEAAVLADGYVLTHINHMRDFSPRYDNRKENRPVRVNAGFPRRSYIAPRNRTWESDADSKCHYCFELGHWKKECPVLSARNKSKVSNVKDVACASSIPTAKLTNVKLNGTQTDPEHSNMLCDEPKITVSDYAPFITEGFVSLVGDAHRVPVKILRDTGASESFICQSVLPFSSLSDIGSFVLIRGIGLQPFPVPLHRIQLQSGFVNGEVTIAVRPTLPVENIDLIIGNNLAGGCVWPEMSCPSPVVKTVAMPSVEPDKCLKDFPEVFTACAVTRAMARAQTVKPSDVSKASAVKVFVPDLPAPLSLSEVIEAQKNDCTLEKYFALASGDDNIDHGYLIQNGLLLRRWSPRADNDVADQVLQVVMPVKYREVVLKAAHGEASGHFGVRKTYNHVLEHFYWPRIKRDIASFVKGCHACQNTNSFF